MHFGATAFYQRGLENRTLHWLNRCTDGKDDYKYVCAIDDLVKKGRTGTAWLDEDGELLILGSVTPRGSLEGLKDFIHYDDVTLVGDIRFEPLFGAIRSDPSQDSYIDLNVAPGSIPGVALNSHSVGAYLTTNFVGPWRILGATGTGGLRSLGLAEGSGFRSGFISGTLGQTLFGDGSCWGWVAGSRVASNNVVTVRQQTLAAAPFASESLPTNDMSLLSSEPGIANSPNRLLVVWIGDQLSQAQLAQQAKDVIRFVRLLGIYNQIEEPPIALGINCFGPDSLDDIIPSDMRVYRQLRFPPTNDTPAASYNGYPITDSLARNSTISTITKTLDSAPIEAFDGKGTVRVTIEDHQLDTAGALRLSGCSATRGITTSQLNRWHQISEVVDANTLEIETAGTATSSGTGGGASATAQLARINEPISEFVPPRGGKWWHILWSNRGERDEEGGPITSPSLRGNDSMGRIDRLTNAPDGGPRAGTECRPAFTTKRLAAGATLVQAAIACGYPERDDTDDPEGEGYLDIAETWGLDPDKVLPWSYFRANADDLFTVALAGSAVCYNYVVMPQRTLDNILTHLTASSKGIWLDCEHGDLRSPELMEEYMTRLLGIINCKGFTLFETGHIKSGQHLINNGWQDGVLARVIELPGIEALNIPTSNVDDVLADLNEQAENFRSATTGEIPWDKISVSLLLGPGKNRIDDEGPLGPQQMPLDKCELVAGWIEDNSVKHVRTNRFGMLEGGEVERVINQQLISYLPNLGADDVPEDALTAIQAWEAKVTDEGGGVSPERFGLLVQFVQRLQDAGVWDDVDDIVLQAGEDNEFSETQASVTLKRRVVTTKNGAPTYTANRGYTYDGVDDYTQTGFTPSTDASAMTGSDLGLAVYLLAGDNTTTGRSAGGINNISTQGLSLNPRPGSTAIQGQANSNTPTITGAAVTAPGLFGFQKDANTTLSAWNKGAQHGTATPSTKGTDLPTREVLIGCHNVNGTPGAFTADEVAMLILFKAFNATKHQALSDACDELMTAIGAID